MGDMCPVRAFMGHRFPPLRIHNKHSPSCIVKKSVSLHVWKNQLSFNLTNTGYFVPHNESRKSKQDQHWAYFFEFQYTWLG